MPASLHPGTALVGSTGFVGQTLARQRPIDDGYHRPDIASIRGRAFRRLYIAGAPAQKWVANEDPEGDAAALETLMDHLRQVQADVVVLVSTVDVYPDPIDVDEATPVDVADHSQAYGRNRLWLEGAVRAHFPGALVVRLPGLFGEGLRKNLVYDLLHDREEYAHRDSAFQFYDMKRLADDIDAAVEAGLEVVNLATPPVAAHVVGQEIFGRRLVRTEGSPVGYDMQTRHASVFGASRDQRYVCDLDAVLAGMRAFVASQGAA